MKKIFFCLTLLLLFGSTYAQVFPVQGNLQMLPPFSPYLTDYTTPGSQKLTLQLLPNDITLGDHSVRLRLSIEGVGITIRTKPNYIPPVPHTLMGGGAPTILYGEDLSDYFNPDNLDFAGFSRSDFQQSGKLPEGVFRFSFEVFDYYRRVPLSNKIMAVSWVVLNDPPLLNLPLSNTKITLIDPVNIAFTWTPRHTASPNAAFSTEYVFKLVEIWPANRNPYDAFLSQPPLYEATINESQLIYGPAEPALITGRKYAWQVQAKDVDGKDVFKNQGKSEVFVFQFGNWLGTPENLRKEWGNDRTLTLRWDPSMTGETPDHYNIRYKALAAEVWYEALRDQQWVTLENLQPNTDYDVQARSKKDNTYSDYTAALRLKTAESSAGNFVCGQPPATVNTDKTSRLLQLTPGDVFTCNDWRIVVREASRATNGEFAGKGLMAVKMFGGASIEVIFHGHINAGYQLITGGVESLYNRGSEMGSVVEEMKKIGEKKTPTPKTPTDTTGIDQVVFPGIIDSVYFDKEKKEVVVVDKEGKKTTYPQKTDPKTKEAKPMQITDSAGNTVTVGKDGTVTKGGTGGGAGGTGGNTTASIDPQVNILMKEILASFSKDIDDHLGESTPVKKGPSADFYDGYFNKPDCLPDDAATLRNIKAYSNELQNNPDQLDQFVNTILKKEENRTYFNDLVKKTLDDYKQKKSYKETLSAKEYKKVREITCPYLVEGGKLSEVKSSTVDSLFLYLGTERIKPNSFQRISRIPEMPDIRIKPFKSGNNDSTEIEVRLKIEYKRWNSHNTQVRNDSTLYPADGWQKVKINEIWDIDFGTEICGGKAYVYYKSGNTTKSEIFYIRGENPTEMEVRNYITSQGYDQWFLMKLIREESESLTVGGAMNQFHSGTNYGTARASTAGCPKIGDPRGFGLMQLDNFGRSTNGSLLVATTNEIWNWKANIDRGVQFLRDDKIDWAERRIGRYLSIIQKWNTKWSDDTVNDSIYIYRGDNEGATVLTIQEGNTTNNETFAIDPIGIQRSIQDATALKYYNGGSYCTLRFKEGTSKPYWTIDRLNDLDQPFNYVGRVCGRDQ